MTAHDTDTIDVIPWHEPPPERRRHVLVPLLLAALTGLAVAVYLVTR